jgi:hypothetical protein
MARHHRLATTSPPWLHWIIITRVDPPIGIRRLQLHGHLAQIRAADLAFNVDETAALMLWFGLDPCGRRPPAGSMVGGLGGGTVPGCRTMQSRTSTPGHGSGW